MTDEDRSRLGRVVRDEVAKISMQYGISDPKWEHLAAEQQEHFSIIGEAAVNAATDRLRSACKALVDRMLMADRKGCSWCNGCGAVLVGIQDGVLTPIEQHCPGCIVLAAEEAMK